MKIDDKILRDILLRKIEQIKQYPKSAQKEVESWMAEKYNVKFSTTVDIFNGLIPMESLSYDLLYKLMKSIRDGLQERWQDFDLSGLHEEKYFTEIEIKQFSEPLIYDTEDDDITFNEWFQLDNNRYSTKASIDEIIRWRNLGKVKYNPDTQRDLIEKTSRGVTIKKVDINQNAINDMFKAMIKGDFKSDDLTLNINTDINTKSDQLPKVYDGKLIVPKDAQIDIIDGFHRYQAMCLAKDTYPDWEFDCGFKITTFDTEQANMFMLYQDKKNHLKPQQTTRINKNDEVNFVLNKLNRSSSFHLKGTFTKNDIYVLNNLITDIFNPQKREESVSLYKLLERNINELVEEKNYFSKKFTSEEWFIYLYLIKISQDDSYDFMDLIDKIKLERVLKELKINKKPLVKHYRLIDKIIKEVKINV